MSKLEKSRAGYIEEENCNFKCDECRYASRDAKYCSYLVKDEADIVPWASCNYFEKGPTASLMGPGSRTKEEAGYEVNTAKVGFGCRRCSYFDAPYKACKEVKGQISGPTGCCNLQEPDKYFGTLTDAALRNYKNRY